MKKFLFFSVIIFLVSCSPKYILVTGTTTQPQQVVSRVVTQPQVVYYATTSQPQPRRRVSINLSGGVQIMNGRVVSGQFGVGAYSGYQQPYYGYGQQRVVYPNYGSYYYGNNYYNPYNYGYNNYYQPLYNQYGQAYPIGSRPAWGYTTPYNY